MAAHTFDLSEYIVNISRKEGLAKGMKPLKTSITLHHACHARAQNMGFKAREILKLIPELQISQVERCSGHGGSFGVKKEFHQIALNVGKPVFEQVQKNAIKASQTNESSSSYFSSECPLAADHIKQGVTSLSKNSSSSYSTPTSLHPIELLAKAYQLNY